MLSGLRHRDARRQFEAFQRFVASNRVLPLHEEAAVHAADFYATTRKAGRPVDDIDIPGLVVQDWAI